MRHIFIYLSFLDRFWFLSLSKAQALDAPRNAGEREQWKCAAAGQRAIVTVGWFHWEYLQETIVSPCFFQAPRAFCRFSRESGNWDGIKDRFVCLSVCVFTPVDLSCCLFAGLSIKSSLFNPIYLPIYQFVHLFAYLWSICRFVRPSINPSIHLFIHPSVYLAGTSNQTKLNVTSSNLIESYLIHTNRIQSHLI